LADLLNYATGGNSFELLELVVYPHAFSGLGYAPLT
jgi:hypothetical protein